LLLERLTGLDKPDLVVTSSYHRLTVNNEDGVELSVGDSQTVLAAGLADSWSRLQDAGVPVVAILDVPTPEFDVPECVVEKRSSLDECAFDRTEALADNTAQLIAAEETGVLLVDLTDWICGTEMCPAVIDDLLVWRDTHHLTATYARYLAPVLAIEMGEYIVPVSGTMP